MRGCWGSANNAFAAPCSTIRPWSIKIARSATSRAKLISCVTITIVRFSCASGGLCSGLRPPALDPALTLARQTKSPQDALPAHAQSQHAAVHRQTNDVDKLVSLPASPTFASSSRARAVASSFGSPLTITGPSIMFSSTVRCGNKLKFWKTNPTC